jgi:Lantibiotic modifying enzyme
MSAAVAADPGAHPRVREHLERVAAAYLRHRWTDDCLRDAAGGGSGWCKGYAGVAFAAAKLLRTIGFTAAEVREAIAPEVERVVAGELGHDVSLCHGVAGRIAVLCWLAGRLAWPELRGHARSLEEAFLERYGEGGWTCGIGTAPDLPSFLLGLSGWHFARLMVADPSAELPLCLGGR